jgi:hypothetical protein
MPHRHVAAAALLALVLLSPVTAPAAPVTYGVKAGINFADFRGEFADLADTKVKMGFVGGAFAVYPFAPDLAVQIEALFSMKGAKSVSQGTDESGNPTRKFDDFWSLRYLEVPVLLRGTLLPHAAVQPLYTLGPTLGFSLGGRFETKSPSLSVDLPHVKPVDFGVAIGAGAGFRLGGRRVVTELRYTTGLSDLYDLADNAESINSVFSLTAGVAF